MSPRRRLAKRAAGLPQARSRTLQISGVHSHGCEVCSKKYQDACDTPLVNARCAEHRERFPRERPLWERNQDPAECCRTDSSPADFSTRQLYKLGGDGEWWQCRRCARTHPYDPTAPGGTK